MSFRYPPASRDYCDNFSSAPPPAADDPDNFDERGRRLPPPDEMTSRSAGSGRGASGTSSAGDSVVAGVAAGSPQYEIPRELQEVLLDFTVHYLIEQPQGDVVDYAMEYFTRLKQTKQRAVAQQHDDHSVNNHHSSNNQSDDESMLSDEEMGEGPTGYKDIGRRKSVFAEAYNPEEDEQDDSMVIYPKSDRQRQSLQEAVKHILLFRSLEPEQLGQVIDAMFERKVCTGEFIIRQGDDGDNFYVVDSGIYHIFVRGSSATEERLVGQYDNQGSFGELALMYNMPRAASIQAVTDGMVWAMDRTTFRKIVLKNAYQKRKMFESLLESVPLLGTLTPYERMNLSDALSSRSFGRGSVIVQQGDPGDGMYFIEDGAVQVFVVGTNGEEKQVTRTQKGGYFGELALVTHKPRAATVKAEGPVRVAFLDVRAFERLLGPCMDVMKRNITDYEDQLVRVFGAKANISDIR